MSIYICEKCGSIDNTSLGGYWKNALRNQPKMCSECNTGKWHGEFPKYHWSYYGVGELLEMENARAIINATEYLKSIGELV